MLSPLRVLLIEHHALMRDALRHHLTPDFLLVGEAATCEEALMLCLSGLRPDVVLLDFDLPDLTGIEATHALLNLLPGLKIIVLIDTPDEGVLMDSIRAGVHAVILKSEPAQVLLDALATVATGSTYLSMAATQRIVSRIRQSSPRTELEAAKQLTVRELQVCRLIAEGLSNKEIAARLTKPNGEPISLNSVRFYRQTAMAKLDARNGVDLVNIMRRQRILLLTSTLIEHRKGHPSR